MKEDTVSGQHDGDGINDPTHYDHFEFIVEGKLVKPIFLKMYKSKVTGRIAISISHHSALPRPWNLPDHFQKFMEEVKLD